MKPVLIYILIVLTLTGAAQNLVPNGSFENVVGCPHPTLPNYYFSCLTNWVNPSSGFPSGSPDMFSRFEGSSCCAIPSNRFGIQDTANGNNYVGLTAFERNPVLTSEFREYIGVALTDTLKGGKEYCFTMYVSLADASNILTTPISAYFSNSPIAVVNNCGPLPYVPQLDFFAIPHDTVHWIGLKAIYIAAGGETFLTIGNFRDSTASTMTTLKGFAPPSQINGCYYYIDNVSLEAFNPAIAGKDTLISCGDSVKIGVDSSWAADYSWSPDTALSNAHIAHPIASPTLTTRYILTKDQCGVITHDTIVLSVKNNCPITPTITPVPVIGEIPNVFTPNEDGVNDAWLVDLKGAKDVYCEIYNRWGNLIYAHPLPSHTVVLWDGRTTSGEKCAEGVYFYTLQYTSSENETIKKKGYISLIR